jgi:hypothetical protein
MNTFIQTDEDRQEWDEFVETSPQGTILAKSWWLDAFDRIARGNQTQIIAVRAKTGGIEVGIPLFIAHRCFGKAVVHPGLVAYCSVILPPIDRKDESRTVERRAELMEQLLSALAGEGFRSIVLTHSPTLQDVREFIWHGWRAAPRYTYVQDLTTFDANATLSRNHGKSCRKAERLGYTAEGREASASDLDQFLPIFANSYRDARRKAYQRDCDAVRAYWPPCVDRRVALYYEAKDASGRVQSARVVLLSCRKTALDWLAATTLEGRNDGATVFLVAEMLKDLRNRGVESLDYSGANVRPIALFKAGFNATLSPYFTTEWRRPGAAKKLRDLVRPLI